jgi:hypothetical protein
VRQAKNDDKVQADALIDLAIRDESHVQLYAFVLFVVKIMFGGSYNISLLLYSNTNGGSSFWAMCSDETSFVNKDGSPVHMLTGVAKYLSQRTCRVSGKWTLSEDKKEGYLLVKTCEVGPKGVMQTALNYLPISRNMFNGIQEVVAEMARKGDSTVDVIQKRLSTLRQKNEKNISTFVSKYFT